MRKQLRRRELTPYDALALVVGHDHAVRWLELFARADLLGIRGDDTGARDELGRRKVRRHSARARFDVLAHRELGEGEATRRVVMLLLAVLDSFGPTAQRTWHNRLWLGRDAALTGHTGGLAQHLGVTPRRVRDFVAVLRGAGILRVWQPRADETSPRSAVSRTGRPYNCWEWVGELPRAYQALRAAYWTDAAKAEHAAERAQLAAPAALPTPSHPLAGRAPSAAGASFAASLLATVEAHGLLGPPT